MKIKLPVWIITLLVSLFIILFGNYSFWRGMTDAIAKEEGFMLLLSFFIVIFMLINLLLTLVSFKPLFKGVAIVILMASALAAYFMDNYAVMIDKEMIRNVLHTDVNEASELFSLRLLVTFLLLGILPSVFIYRVNIDYQPLLKGLIQKAGIVIITLGIIVGTLYSNYQEISFFGREHRELRYLINPINYIFSLKSIISRKLKSGIVVVKPIENDARKILQPTNNKPSLVIMVLGETARAMNFSLDGYERDTNPLMAKQDVINFTDVSSCGTATAVSVPCLFSKYTRDEYSHSKGERNQNLLDVVSHSQYDVLWLDNNTGCQGLCDRINYIDLAHSDDPKYCAGGNCVDEILLDSLQERVDQAEKNNKDQFIVLHQKGNHGPTYHRRYPDRFTVFKPVCQTNQLRLCSREEVVNAYDNAILYTDFFLDKTIDFLKKNTDKFNTAMIYFSDHGESLGEKGVYLHGLPYLIAPEYQKKVPLMLWLSDEYQQGYGLNKACIAKQSGDQLSHDNIFSSVLGLLAIETKVRDRQLDIFEPCKAVTNSFI